MLIYLISLLFACETSFLGFELDLLTHEFLVSFVCWISTLRNPWYSYFSSIYFSYTDSCSFFSGCSYPETPVIAPDTPDHKTQSIRAYTRSIRAESATERFLSVFELQIAYSPPSSRLKVLSGRWASLLEEASRPRACLRLRTRGGSGPPQAGCLFPPR